MWKQIITTTALAILIVGCNLYTYSRGKSIQQEISTRDCELTGVHISDNDTVLVCQVIERVEPKANETGASGNRGKGSTTCE